MHCAPISCPYFPFTFPLQGHREKQNEEERQTFFANLCHLQHNILKFEVEYLKIIFQNLLLSQTLGKGIISMEGKSNLKNVLVEFIKCKNC